MLIMKIAAGESAIKNDGIGDIRVAMLATNQFRVYVEGGLLPSGDEDACFNDIERALGYAAECAERHVVEFVEQTWVE